MARREEALLVGPLDLSAPGVLFPHQCSRLCRSRQPQGGGIVRALGLQPPSLTSPHPEVLGHRAVLGDRAHVPLSGRSQSREECQ